MAFIHPETDRHIETLKVLSGQYLPGGPLDIKGALRAAITALRETSVAAPGEVFRHKKRGTLYTLIGVGRVQGTLADEDPVVLYRGENGGLWARHQAEFCDGRFEHIGGKPEAVASSATDTSGKAAERIAELEAEIKKVREAFAKPIVQATLRGICERLVEDIKARPGLPERFHTGGIVNVGKNAHMGGGEAVLAVLSPGVAMATIFFPAIIERGVGEFGVYFPDLPGCVSAGRTVNEAAAGAEEALRGHLIVMAKHNDPIPTPSKIDAIKAFSGSVEVARILVRGEWPCEQA